MKCLVVARQEGKNFVNHVRNQAGNDQERPEHGREAATAFLLGGCRLYGRRGPGILLATHLLFTAFDVLFPLQQLMALPLKFI
jgi:hypothetical protein